MPTIAETIAQSIGANHEGNSVVDNSTTEFYDWGTKGWDPHHPSRLSDSPPAGMTEITGYVHSYNIKGLPVVPGQMYCRNMQTWVRSGGVWSRVEMQGSPHIIAGAHFVGDMQGGATALTIAPTNDAAEVHFPAPPATENCHWWIAPRGQLPAGVDATVFAAEVKCDTGVNVIAGAGTDWWRVGGGWPGGNAASLLGSFRILTPEWKWICCTNLTEAELTASHPSIVQATDPGPDPQQFSINGSVIKGTDGKLSVNISFSPAE